MTTAGVVFLMVRVGDDFIAGFMMFACEEFLQGEDTSDQERYLGQQDGFSSSEGDDTEEQRDEGHDLQFSDGQEGDQLLDLLLLATSWK